MGLLNGSMVALVMKRFYLVWKYFTRQLAYVERTIRKGPTYVTFEMLCYTGP